MTFTRNEGRTVTPTSQAPTPVVYTQGIVALDRANQLLAMSNNALLTSKDAGCTWTTVGKVTGSNIGLVAATGDRAYAWDRDGNLSLVTPGDITPLTSPASQVVGVGTDRRRGDHLRVSDGVTGQLYDSKDGGRTWQPVGLPAWPQNELHLIYTAAFDPNNLDHVVVGGSDTGARVTFDGGRTWSTSEGQGDGINTFSAVVSPAAPNVVYAMGLNLKEMDQGVPSQGRHIYRSTDGGKRFSPVVDQDDAITIHNGPLLAAHPTNPNVLYFVYGTSWAGYGTDIYRYDSRRNQVTTNHNSYDRVSSIAFSPSDSKVMYLGVAEEG
ncbi:hypothetical protein ACFQYP_16145 [Nonomuraea antimicrobica]|uniref:sialidase family protein n=1 Tax=Nonomuraea antimicrobica TaxID=561173 RepID=UPI0031EAEBC4